MEPTSLQRKAAFVLAVMVLAGLGVYLFVPSAFGAFGPGPATPPHSAGPDGGTPAATPSGSPRVTAAASPAATAPAAPAGSVAPDIYQWLPFTESGLAVAAKVVTAFADDYGTFSYSENAASYVGKMRNLITPGLSAVLARAFAAPGVASQRVSRKQVATGASAVRSLRAFGTSSLTFVVAISQEITDTQGRSKVTVPYAVTVTGGGGSWQVSDIELASAGNP
jgi:hypothetical protein